jgi:hypothetical protein
MDERRWAKGIEVAARLRHLALLLREARVGTRESSSALPRDFAEEFDAKDPTLRRVQSAIEELDALLEGMSFDVSSTQLEEGEFWSLGSIDVHHRLRPIHAGFVEPTLRLPINEPLPERVVAFLLQIPGDRELLKREHHDHFGWHYHYLDYKKRRSNIILCWDTRLHRAEEKRLAVRLLHAAGP